MVHSQVKRIPGDNIKFLDNTIGELKNRGVEIGWTNKIRYPREAVNKQIAAERHENTRKKLRNYSHPKNSKPGELVGTVAARNELGAGVPARPFIRPTIDKEHTNWAKLFTKLCERSIDGKIKPQDILETIGKKASENVQDTITKVFSPPLSEETIARRVHKYKNTAKIGNLTKPLVETSLMISSCTYDVVKTK